MSEEPQQTAADTGAYDDDKVKIPQLNIGESDPNNASLVALEMKDTQKTGFSKRRPMRKKSIDRIFGKMGHVELEDTVDKSPLKGVPRRSLVALDPSIMRDGPAESDSE